VSTAATFGIEGLTAAEIEALFPKRVTVRGLRTLSNAALLRLRNIVSHEQSYWQSYAHAHTLSARLTRIETEMDRRGLTKWLEKSCSGCGEFLRLVEVGGELMGQCRCTRQLNGEV
jgi:hypothetical protein